MRNFLAHLDECFPRIFCCESCAIRALCVVYKVFDLEHLFKDRRGQNLDVFRAIVEWGEETSKKYSSTDLFLNSKRYAQSS